MEGTSYAHCSVICGSCSISIHESAELTQEYVMYGVTMEMATTTHPDAGLNGFARQEFVQGRGFWFYH